MKLLTTFFVMLSTCLPVFCVEHGLLVTPEKQVLGWGSNEYGQISKEFDTFLESPRLLPLKVPVASIAKGEKFSMALDATGQVWTWGDNSLGQLGLGNLTPQAQANLVKGLETAAIRVAAGDHHALVLLRNGNVMSWGSNAYGQLGHGRITRLEVFSSPQKIDNLQQVQALAAGNHFSLARHADGTVSQWGTGQLEPHKVAGLPPVERIRADGRYAMAIDRKGFFWRWQPGQADAPKRSDLVTYELLGRQVSPQKPLPIMVANSTAKAAAKTTNLATPTNSAPMVAMATKSVPTTVTPTPTPAASTQPSSTPPAPAKVKEITLPEPKPDTNRLAIVVSGRVLLGVAAEDESARPVADAVVYIDDKPCATTNSQGRFSCSTSPGWSGRLSVKKNNYRFSPNAMAFSKLQLDAQGLDFLGSYDPR